MEGRVSTGEEPDAADQMDGRTAESAGPRPAEPLTVSHSVIVDMVRVAALEVPGVQKVGRGGPLSWLAGSPVRARLSKGRVSVRVWIVARPGHALRPLAAQVRQAVATTIERLLGLELGEVTVVVDGIGGLGK